jgi:hypothetical protein
VVIEMGEEIDAMEGEMSGDIEWEFDMSEDQAV